MTEEELKAIEKRWGMSDWRSGDIRKLIDEVHFLWRFREKVRFFSPSMVDNIEEALGRGEGEA